MSETKKVLAEIEKSLSLKTASEHSPKEYFRDRKGLYVFSSFVRRILEKAETTPTNIRLDISSYTLTEDATDEQIEASLPEKHIFSETEVCAVIAGLIEKQPRGEEGTLLADGNLNLFYTPACVVSVGWHADDGGWYVFTWSRDGHEWYAGLRVFSPATDL